MLQFENFEVSSQASPEAQQAHNKPDVQESRTVSSSFASL
jgi:hypothetical protein